VQSSAPKKSQVPQVFLFLAMDLSFLIA
jgi:hypothetical protein